MKAARTLVETLDAAIDAVRERARERVKTGGDPDELLDVVSAVAEVSATALVSLGNAAYHGTELAEIGQDAELSNALARTLLFGPPPSADVRYQVTVYGIDTDRDYVAFRARPCSVHSRDELAQELLGTGSGRPSDALVAHLDGDLVGFLAAPPTGVRTGLIGVGPPRPPERLAESFHLASRAADCAKAFGLSGVHSFDTLGLLPTILADADIGESLQRRYVRPAAGIESQPEMLNTIRTYFACGMHVHRAANALFLHPNTLRYRITRFEELTGARLRDPANAMEVWWALQHHALTGGKAA